MLYVRNLGAVGDGKADDTAAIQAAVDAAGQAGGGIVHVAPGRYRTGPIAMADHVTLQGESSWSYREPGSTVLMPADPQQPCLIDMSHAKGCRLVGMGLHGQRMGEGMHGVKSHRPRHKPEDNPRPRPKPGSGQTSVPWEERMAFAMKGDEPFKSDLGEQNLVIDDCWIGFFTGSGVHLERSHVWLVRHSLVVWNSIDGINGAKSADAWAIDNQVGFNGRYGMHIGSSTTVTANRIEQNEQAGLHFNDIYLEDSVATGNHFCSNRGPGIEVLESCEQSNVRGVTLTGNHLRNSGLGMLEDPDRCTHIRLSNVAGVTCVGNMLHALRSCPAPTKAMVLENLTDCVVQGNSMHKGALQQLIDDRGGHERTVIADNVGSLKLPTDENA